MLTLRSNNGKIMEVLECSLPMITLAHPVISDEERRRRKVAVQQAFASVQLEGFVVTEQEQRRGQAFIDGKMTLQEFVTGD
ncbi:antitoxin VbhA family protein [Bordetella sp. FB-8]|uniref:antitoxin VbhA family protein n=1 Tax=Bordetella sp. FB-8 TaxID=1159870 RepID=UPI000379A222|nr:antitoxin VbhA family protein [Bordetella sp. FB-8]